jgi:cytoskeletal protein CcmA (bactofilin family)
MAFGLSKPGTHHRKLSDLPNEWVGWLEPGVEVEGKMKVTGGLFRLNSSFKGEIVSEGSVVVHDQGEVDGNIQCRVLSITGKVKGTVHAKERLEIKEHGSVVGDIYTSCLLVDPGGFFDGQCHMHTPEAAIQPSGGVDSQEHLLASTAETKPT